jgi:hypothetical protein
VSILQALKEGKKMQFQMLDQKMGKSHLGQNFGFGVIVVAAIIVSMVTAQTLWPQTVKNITMLARQTLMAPVPPHAAPKAAPPEQPQQQQPRKQFTPPKDNVFRVPSAVPPKVSMEIEPPSEAPTLAVCTACAVGSVPSAGPGGFGLDVLALPTPPPSPAPKEVVKPVSPKQIRVGGSVQTANLI